mmetsp:Transcript_17282/g.51997  ORF Transcript_17282/g.51997 Transcript_17282/m.51997 type:complete len:351 (+) Transcript_17282:214-1266(+)
MVFLEGPEVRPEFHDPGEAPLAALGGLYQVLLRRHGDVMLLALSVLERVDQGRQGPHVGAVHRADRCCERLVHVPHGREERGAAVHDHQGPPAAPSQRASVPGEGLVAHGEGGQFERPEVVSDDGIPDQGLLVEPLIDTAPEDCTAKREVRMEVEGKLRNRQHLLLDNAVKDGRGASASVCTAKAQDSVKFQGREELAMLRSDEADLLLLHEHGADTHVVDSKHALEFPTSVNRRKVVSLVWHEKSLGIAEVEAPAGQLGARAEAADDGRNPEVGTAGVEHHVEHRLGLQLSGGPALGADPNAPRVLGAELVRQQALDDPVPLVLRDRHAESNPTWRETCTVFQKTHHLP